MMRRALVPLAPAFAAIYGWSIDDAMNAPWDVLVQHVADLPRWTRAVDGSDVAIALSAVNRMRS